MTVAGDRRRRSAAVAMVVVTALLLAAAAVCWYARSALADSDEFTARATAALDDSDLRVVLADRVVGGLTPGVVPDALAVRPLIVPVIAELADTSAFRGVFARVVAQRHRALMDGESSFALSVPVGEGPVYEGLRRLAPRVADRIPPDLRAPVLTLDPFTFELEAARALDDFAGLRWLLLIAALLAAAGCALLAGGGRAAFVHVGVAVAGAGLLVAAVVAGLGEFVVSHAAHAADLSDERERGAVRSLWNAFFGDLAAAGLVAALGGAVVAAVSASRRPELDLAVARRRLHGAATSPRGAARIGGGLALIAVGAMLVLEPALLARIALIAAGVAIVLVGVAQLVPAAQAEDAGARGGATPAEGVDGEADVAAGGLAGRGDHDHDLAPDLVPEAPHQLAQGAAGDLLVELGELAADRGRAVWGERRQRRQRLRQAAGGLEGDHGLGRLQHALELAGAARQEPEEAPAVGGQPRGDQRRDHRRGAGQHLDLEVAVDAGPDQAIAGIGDRRGACVGDEHDRLAALDHLRQLARPLGLVLLVVGDQPRRLQLQQLQQPAGAAGVLAGDQVGPRERVAGAGGDVAEVAERRRADG
jgi:hypothetical protein